MMGYGYTISFFLFFLEFSAENYSDYSKCTEGAFVTFIYFFFVNALFFINILFLF